MWRLDWGNALTCSFLARLTLGMVAGYTTSKYILGAAAAAAAPLLIRY